MNKSANLKSHTVTITVDDQGNFRYGNPLVWVRAGETIVWECTNKYPFAVHIGWDSPLEYGRYRSSGDPIKANVMKDARPGYFRYSVAVFDGKNIWTDDPEIIVRRPPLP